LWQQCLYNIDHNSQIAGGEWALAIPLCFVADDNRFSCHYALCCKTTICQTIIYLYTALTAIKFLFLTTFQFFLTTHIAIPTFPATIAILCIQYDIINRFCMLCPLPLMPEITQTKMSLCSFFGELKVPVTFLSFFG